MSSRCPQGSSGVGGEVGIAGTGGQNDDPAFFHMTDGAPPDIGLGHFVHFDGGHDPSRYAGAFGCLLQRQRIEDRCHHAHVIGGGTVHTLDAGGDAAPDNCRPQ